MAKIQSYHVSSTISFNKHLALVPGWNNCLVSITNHLTNKCIYANVITGPYKGGVINCRIDELIIIPDSIGLFVF